MWNATSGNSNGWGEWTIDLSAYAGKKVEISIAYATDWSTQGLGVFVDDTTVSTGETTSFEDGLGGWTVSGSPAGSAANANDWISTTSDGFPEGAAISTPDSIYFGFGFEGISTPSTRNAVMGRAMDFLLESDNRFTESLDRVPGPGESLIWRLGPGVGESHRTSLGTRNGGVRGSSPRVGFPHFRGSRRRSGGSRCARWNHSVE